MGRAEPTACSLEEQRRLRASPNHYKSISFPFLGAVTGWFFFLLPGCMGWSHVIVAGCCAPCGITLLSPAAGIAPWPCPPLQCGTARSLSVLWVLNPPRGHPAVPPWDGGRLLGGSIRGAAPAARRGG